MVVKNIEAVNRQLANFTAESSGGSINFSGKYRVKLKNQGRIPTPVLRLNIIKLALGTGDKLIQEKTKGVGRLKPKQTKTVSFGFNVDLDKTAELESIARAGCNDNAIEISSKESLIGRLLISNIEVSGGVDVSSNECDIESIISPEPEPPEDDEPPLPELPEPTPEPEPPEEEPEPPEDEPQPPEDGEDGDGGVPESQDLTIEGPVSSKVGQTHSYQVADVPDNTEALQWNSSASEEQISGENEYSVTFDSVSNETVGVRAIDENNNELGVGQIEVIVVGDNQEQARESNSDIDGLRFVSTGQEAEYTWSSFPDNTQNFGWQLLAEEENTGATLEGGTLNAGSISVNFQSDTPTNYLIVIAASANGEVIEQVQKQVTVLPTPE